MGWCKLHSSPSPQRGQLSHAKVSLSQPRHSSQPGAKVGLFQALCGPSALQNSGWKGQWQEPATSGGESRALSSLRQKGRSQKSAQSPPLSHVACGTSQAARHPSLPDPAELEVRAPLPVPLHPQCLP